MLVHACEHVRMFGISWGIYCDSSGILQRSRNADFSGHKGGRTFHIANSNDRHHRVSRPVTMRTTTNTKHTAIRRIPIALFATFHSLQVPPVTSLPPQGKPAAIGGGAQFPLHRVWTPPFLVVAASTNLAKRASTSPDVKPVS